MVLAGAVAGSNLGTGSSPRARGPTPPPSSGAAPAATPLEPARRRLGRPGCSAEFGQPLRRPLQSPPRHPSDGHGRKRPPKRPPSRSSPDASVTSPVNAGANATAHRQGTDGCRCSHRGGLQLRRLDRVRAQQQDRERERLGEAGRGGWVVEHDARFPSTLTCSRLGLEKTKHLTFRVRVGRHKDAGPSALLGSQASSVAASPGWSKAIGGRIRPVSRVRFPAFLQLGSARLRAVDAAIADPKCLPASQGRRAPRHSLCRKPAREGPPSSAPSVPHREPIGCRPACRYAPDYTVGSHCSAYVGERRPGAARAGDRDAFDAFAAGSVDHIAIATLNLRDGDRAEIHPRRLFAAGGTSTLSETAARFDAWLLRLLFRAINDEFRTVRRHQARIRSCELSRQRRTSPDRSPCASNWIAASSDFTGTSGRGRPLVVSRAVLGGDRGGHRDPARHGEVRLHYAVEAMRSRSRPGSSIDRGGAHLTSW